MKIVVSVSCLISHCGMRSSSENIDSTEHTRGGVQVEPWTERCDMRGSAYGEARGDALAQTASILDQLNCRVFYVCICIVKWASNYLIMMASQKCLENVS